MVRGESFPTSSQIQPISLCAKPPRGKLFAEAFDLHNTQESRTILRYPQDGVGTLNTTLGKGSIFLRVILSQMIFDAGR